MVDAKARENGLFNINTEFGDSENDKSNSSGSVVDTIRDANIAVNVTLAGLQTESLQAAIDNFAHTLNQAAIGRNGLPVQTASAQFKGFVAEEYFKNTLKINSLAKGVPDWQIGIYTNGNLPDGSILSKIDTETDISIWTRKYPWSRPERTADYQAKIHNDPLAYRRDINNPKYSEVNLVGGTGQGVNDTIKVNVGGKEVKSDTITPEQATKYADAMKEQNSPKYQKASEKHGELNKVNLERAIAAGAAAGLILTTISEIVDVIKNRDNLSEDQFIESVTNIMCGTIDGGIRGGAIMGSVQLLGKVVGKEVTTRSLESVPVMAIANTTVDFAKDLYKCFVVGAIDADDLLCNTVNNTFSSFAGYGGSYIGIQVASSFASIKASATTGAAIGSALGPAGIIVGSVVGGVVIGVGARAIIKVANKDAQKIFNECISEINAHIELSGYDKMYYFADSMSSISEYRLSFKNLLPCHNLISDLKEYNIRKKAIKNVHQQLDASIASKEMEKSEALKDLENQHYDRLRELKEYFNEQRELMFDDFKESMNTYVANSYSQYISYFEVLSGEIELIKETLDNRTNMQSAILKNLRKRSKVNVELNETLVEIMNDQDSASLLRPFVDKLEWFMQQDELMIGRQYLSLDEALILVKGVQV